MDDTEECLDVQDETITQSQIEEWYDTVYPDINIPTDVLVDGRNYTFTLYMMLEDDDIDYTSYGSTWIIGEDDNSEIPNVKLIYLSFENMNYLNPSELNTINTWIDGYTGELSWSISSLDINQQEYTNVELNLTIIGTLTSNILQFQGEGLDIYSTYTFTLTVDDGYTFEVTYAVNHPPENGYLKIITASGSAIYDMISVQALD